MLSEKEKKEWKALSTSQTFKEDMRHLKANRHNPLLEDGKVDLNKLIEFLTTINAFFNHQQKPFKPIVDKVMKL